MIFKTISFMLVLASLIVSFINIIHGYSILLLAWVILLLDFIMDNVRA